jgi:RHS repeat-associated protein
MTLSLGLRLWENPDQRFYASTYGRFVTPDPSSRGIRLVDPKSWNSYEYVGDDPVNLVDPNGESWCSPNCGARGVQLTVGILQGVAAVGVGAASGLGEIFSGGTLTPIAAGGALAALGLGTQSVLNITGAVTGNPNFGTAATAVGVATNPVQLVTAVVTGGNLQAASTVGSIFSAGQLLTGNATWWTNGTIRAGVSVVGSLMNPPTVQSSGTVVGPPTSIGVSVPMMPVEMVASEVTQEISWGTGGGYAYGVTVSFDDGAVDE